MIAAMAKEAKQAARLLVRSTAEERSTALSAMANELLDQKELIVQANSIDLEAAQKNGISGAMLNRLELGENGVEKIARAVSEIS